MSGIPGYSIGAPVLEQGGRILLVRHARCTSSHYVLDLTSFFTGEAASSKDKGLMESLSIDIPLDGLGLIGFPAADAISPVYTIWITLVVMYLGRSHMPLLCLLKLSTDVNCNGLKSSIAHNLIILIANNWSLGRFLFLRAVGMLK